MDCFALMWPSGAAFVYFCENFYETVRKFVLVVQCTIATLFRCGGGGGGGEWGLGLGLGG